MTITLRSESQGIRPQFDYTEGHVRPAIVSRYSPASVRVRAVTSPSLAYSAGDGSPVRTFQLRWKNTGQGERELLFKAWTDSRGGVLPMDFTRPGDIDANKVSVVFSSRPREKRLSAYRWELEADLREVG